MSNISITPPIPTQEQLEAWVEQSIVPSDPLPLEERLGAIVNAAIVWATPSAVQAAIEQYEVICQSRVEEAANAEIEECTRALGVLYPDNPEIAENLRQARRPANKSLKDQGLDLLERLRVGGEGIQPTQLETIRRALEALPDEPGGME